MEGVTMTNTKKRISMTVLMILFVSMFAAAQSSRMPTASQLVTRYQNLAQRYEALQRRTSTPQGYANTSDADVIQLARDSETLAIDCSFFLQSGGTFTPDQEKDILNSQRRITVAGTGIQTNIAQFGR
jgi:hypothetical protein